ncbi:MAG: crotonase/enoyl-CoA hydratase family protein [Pseudomonadota bacterium]
MNCSLDDDIAHISTDDGKANVVNQAFVDGMLEGLEKAKSEAKAVVLSGRSGMFSAGFDLKTLQKGGDEASNLVNGGMRILTEIYSHPQPVIVACDGHAIGLGAFILLASDFRIGSTSGYNITLPETAIGMPFTPVLMTLIHDRIGSNHQTAAVLQSKPHGPDDAIAAGFLDRTVEAAALMAEASAFAAGVGELPGNVYGANKVDLRSKSLAEMRTSLS